MKTRTSKPIELLVAAVATVLLGPASAWANTTRITELIGHPVVTDSGERLGNIEDFAVDPGNGQLAFVVKECRRPSTSSSIDGNG